MTLLEICEHIAKTHGLTVKSRGGIYSYDVESDKVRLFVMAECFDSGKYAGQKRVLVCAQRAGGPRTTTQYYSRIPLEDITPDNKNINAAVKRLVDLEIDAYNTIQTNKQRYADQSAFENERMVALSNPDIGIRELVELLVKDASLMPKLDVWQYIPHMQKALKKPRTVLAVFRNSKVEGVQYSALVFIASAVEVFADRVEIQCEDERHVALINEAENFEWRGVQYEYHTTYSMDLLPALKKEFDHLVLRK